jgi:hypothetical protein
VSRARNAHSPKRVDEVFSESQAVGSTTHQCTVAIAPSPVHPRAPKSTNGGLPGRVTENFLAPLLGELFSETNDDLVAILLTYATARVLLAGDA